MKSADQCTMGLNFVTLRPRQEILADYVRILERIYDPVTYAGRLRRLAEMLENCGRKTRRQHSRKMLHRNISNLPEPRDLFGRTLTQCVETNPDSTRRILLLMALYSDVGAFSRDLIARIETMIDALGPAAIEPRSRAERAISSFVM